MMKMFCLFKPIPHKESRPAIFSWLNAKRLKAFCCADILCYVELERKPEC